MNPLIQFSLLWIPIVTILSLGGVRYMWLLVQRERMTYTDGRVVTLTRLLAAVVTLGFLGGLILTAPVVAFVLDAPIEVRRVTGNLTVIAIDLLIALPLAIAAYLRWGLRRGAS